MRPEATTRRGDGYAPICAVLARREGISSRRVNNESETRHRNRQPRAGMVPRDPAEPGRGSTSLELFLDLVFAAAVGLASSSFHSAVLHGGLGASLAGYAMVFFAIWWAWMNFTWFASAYDCDDAAYRLTTLIQMAGVLILAAGVPDAMAGRGFTLIVAGYVVMRIAMISQWLRAAVADPPRRHVAVTYAVGIAAVQLGWVAWLFIPWAAAFFVVFAALELAVPVIAEYRATTPWHGGHIADRYGSFTLIVLGGTVLAATNAVIIARNDVSHVGTLVTVSASGLVLAGSLWWLYFDRPQHDLLTDLAKALRWGYGHYFIFAAVATLSVGIEIVLDYDIGRTALSHTAAAAFVTAPAAVFVIMFWALSLRHRADVTLNVTVLAGALAIGCTAWLNQALPAAAILAALVAATATIRARQADHA